MLAYYHFTFSLVHLLTCLTIRLFTDSLPPPYPIYSLSHLLASPSYSIPRSHYLSHLFACLLIRFRALPDQGELLQYGEIPKRTGFLYKHPSELFREKLLKVSRFFKERIEMVSCNCQVMHAITSKGQLYAWGDDPRNYGTLGLGNNESIPEPYPVQTLAKIAVKYVSTGEKHAAAVDINGDVYTWGTALDQELVQGDQKISKTPARIRHDRQFTRVHCKGQMTLLLSGKPYPFSKSLLRELGELGDPRYSD